MPAENYDLVRNYGYILEMQGERAGYFTKVIGMGMEVEAIGYRAGGDPSIVRQLPGRTMIKPITLCWGVSSSTQMENWFRSAVEGRVERINTSLIILGPDGQSEQARWNFTNAWLSSWAGAEFDSLGNGIAIQSMTMVADHMARAGSGS